MEHTAGSAGCVFLDTTYSYVGPGVVLFRILLEVSYPLD